MDRPYVQLRRQPKNLVPPWKCQIIMILHFFRLEIDDFNSECHENIGIERDLHSNVAQSL